MSLFRKPHSPYWWYSFTYDGKRYRQSTKEKNKGSAAAVAADALLKLKAGDEILSSPASELQLQDFAKRFLSWVENSQKLKPTTQRYYRYGWRLISFTRLPSMPMDAITTEAVDCTRFERPIIDRKTKREMGEFVPCSATYTNQALRTLNVMMGKAVEWGVLKSAPAIHRLKSSGRDRMIDQESEAKLQKAHLAPMKHGLVRFLREQAWLVMVILQDTGMRPNEVFPMRIENIHWNDNYIWIPEGKTDNARRKVGMSDRVKQMLSVWCTGRDSGWVFPTKRKSKSGHLTTITKGFQAARSRAAINPKIVPYSARHTFATNMLAATGNIFAVSKAMGHAGVKSMTPYQHPDTTILVNAINEHNKNKWHTFRHTDQDKS